jgi:putative PEP-CTERM system histidine kinase
MPLGYYSYLLATLGFGFLAILLSFSWRSTPAGRLLIIVVVVSTLWAGLAAGVAVTGAYQSVLYQSFEIVRYLAWYAFLLKLLEPVAARRAGYRRFLRRALPSSIGFGLLLLVAELLSTSLFSPDQEYQRVLVLITGHVCLAVIGLAIIEQLYRNTSVEHRWAIKYLFIGAGGIFAYDFYLYSDALLFRSIDRDLWDARGLINLLAVPLLTIAAARNQNWALRVFVSRDIVLHTTTIVGGGLYLLVVGGLGYYLRDFGGAWGRLAQILFFSLAVVLLMGVLFSGQMRTRLRVFLGKHFYRNKYDYRREWLRLTGDLNENMQGRDRYQAVIRVLARLVDARAGLLWLRDEQGGFVNAAAWNTDRLNRRETDSGSLVRFLREKLYVINLLEQESRAEEYAGLELPEWAATMESGWLIVPLPGTESLLGFIVLARPLITRPINWEDRDLLLTAAKQVSSYLTVLMTSEALGRARQFEVFNRVAAYMVHDLKNIAAELEMVARNADKHRHNPEFLVDAFASVASASDDIRRLLEQLRSKQVQIEKDVVLDLGSVVREVVKRKQDQRPVPRLTAVDRDCLVIAATARLTNVLAHLIDNACQATAQDGRVEVKLQAGNPMCRVEIRDNGQGMAADFIRDRLFEPFDTTKGNAGMGIGMYESREYIRRLGGNIQVQSEPGRGTIVTLHIPVYTGTSAGREPLAGT